jgi:hypothetical protein
MAQFELQTRSPHGCDMTSYVPSLNYYDAQERCWILRYKSNNKAMTRTMNIKTRKIQKTATIDLVRRKYWNSISIMQLTVQLNSYLHTATAMSVTAHFSVLQPERNELNLVLLDLLWNKCIAFLHLAQSSSFATPRQSQARQDNLFSVVWAADTSAYSSTEASSRNEVMM